MAEDQSIIDRAFALVEDALLGAKDLAGDLAYTAEQTATLVGEAVTKATGDPEKGKKAAQKVYDRVL